MLVGSHAEGNANQASDIDLIAVEPSEWRGRLRTGELEVQGRIIGVIYIGAKQLRRRIAALDTVYRAGTYGWDGLATRLSEAVLVYDTDGVGCALIEEARRYQPSAGALREVARAALTFYQDVMGSLNQRDPETAILMARQAATIAVDCFLLRHGFRSLKPKWHFRRLRQVDAPSVIVRYRRVLGLDEATDHRQALRALAEVDRLLCEVLQIDNIQEFERSPLWARC